MDFKNTYADSERAEAYARLEFANTYYLAYRDVPQMLREHVTGSQALDFGCGTGRSSRFLRSLGFVVTGVDIAHEMIAKARERDPDGDYRLLAEGDFAPLGAEQFDLVLSMFTFDNVPGRGTKVRILRDLRGLLKPSGKLVSVVSAPEIYVNEWASFSTKDFPENRTARAGDIVRIVTTDFPDRRPTEDILFTNEAYRDLYTEVGFSVAAMHKPLARGDEPYGWVNETRIAPWVVYILSRRDDWSAPGSVSGSPTLRSRPRILQRRCHILYAIACTLMTPKSKNSNGGSTAVLDATANLERERVFAAYRQFGYLEGDLDPLGFLRPRETPELEREGEYAREARAIYSSTIGVEINHIYSPERRRWVYEQMESEPPQEDQQRILELLIRADIFEQVMQQRYLGSKRFSLEGVTALIPLVDEVLDTGSRLGAIELVMGMSHRGRLNVIAHVARRPPQEIFAGFEDVDPRSVLGSGDVKYHMGATGEYATRSGGKVHIHLVSNPSHLEAVDPVTIGRTRAKQDRAGEGGRQKYLPLLVHGDAAFAGQGILAETMNYADLPGYTAGGTIHVVVNNLLGFTTSYTEEHSTRFAACIARRQSIPIFHVNAEDPDAVVRVARLATEYRYKFGTDVVIDLIGYRRHGHSEVDDPTITQPLLYKKIKEHPPLWQIYAEDIGAENAQAQADAIRSEFEAAQKQAGSIKQKPLMRELPKYWDGYFGGLYKPEYDVETGLSPEELAQLTERLTTYPADFHIHPKVKKLLEQRAEMGAGKRLVDYGMAEALAFASLVKNGTHVRFSGQDSRRGTFNQRHSVLIDIENEDEYVPLENIAPGQARCEIYNSTLSEAGVLGFEYGYSRDYPESLVLWEAQFGDFVNVAQAIIDQFISAGEAKWNLLSGLVMLLPHGYEGQGPEHSSARIERFIQLAAKHNIQVAQPSNAAQYFHLLRRQALRHWRKPLIVFTPKSMLRHADASSPIEDFTHKRFLNVIPDTQIGEAERILICTGKIGHELQAERRKRKDTTTAIVFLEQMYPFPEQEVIAEFDRHGKNSDIVWVQEEPANMGAMFNMLPRLKRIAGERPVLSVKRSSSPSPATGSAKAHEVEQKTLLTLAFTIK